MRKINENIFNAEKKDTVIPNMQRYMLALYVYVANEGRGRVRKGLYKVRDINIIGNLYDSFAQSRDAVDAYIRSKLEVYRMDKRVNSTYQA
jgi:hypothetical protein